MNQYLDALDRRQRQKLEPIRTFGSFAEEWKKTSVLGGDLRESQVESDLSILKNHLAPAFGHLGLRDIDARVIDRYKADKRHQKHQYGDGYNPHTINNHLSVLHRIMQKALEYKLVDANPVMPSAWLRPETTPEDGRAWWTPREEAQAMAHLRTAWRSEHPGRYMALVIQLVVGMRFGELRALEKQDLDLTVPGIWVRRSMARKAVTTPKNKKARFHVIPRALADELKAWMLKNEGQRLFPGPDGGAIPNNSLNRWYRELATEAGIREITSHGARHTTGSSYAVMGASQKMIAVMLGHADTRATETYTKLQPWATAPLVEERWARLTDPAAP